MNKQLIIKINTNGKTVMAVSYDISEKKQMEDLGMNLSNEIVNSSGSEKGAVLAVTNAILSKNGGFYGMSQRTRNKEMACLWDLYKIRVYNNDRAHEHKKGLLIFRPEIIHDTAENCDYLKIIECQESVYPDYAEMLHVCNRLDPYSESITCACGASTLGRRFFLK